MFSHTSALRWCRRGTNLHLPSAQPRTCMRLLACMLAHIQTLHEWTLLLFTVHMRFGGKCLAAHALCA